MKTTKIEFDITSLPPVIAQHLKHDAIVHDSSSSAEARTLLFQGTPSVFLKIMPSGRLEREYRMNLFLNTYGLSPAVIAYTTTAQHDYLLTAAVVGQDGIAETFLQQPERLATALGQHLRKLHALPVEGCPYPDRSQEIFKEASASVQTELQTELAFFPHDDLQPLRYQPVDTVLIHGDYCLPNVIMHDDLTLSGFIDVGDGGIGDLHYDLAWGLWSLHYNLDTHEYDDYFLDGYGRELIDLNGIAYFRKIIDSQDF